MNINELKRMEQPELIKLIDFANKFHRVNECGEIKKGGI